MIVKISDNVLHAIIRETSIPSPVKPGGVRRLKKDIGASLWLLRSSCQETEEKERLRSKALGQLRKLERCAEALAHELEEIAHPRMLSATDGVLARLGVASTKNCNFPTVEAFEIVTQLLWDVSRLQRLARRARNIPPTPRKSGRPRTNLFEAEECPETWFDWFVYQFVYTIESRGGRATIDMTLGKGSLPNSLELLKPYIPQEALPCFLHDPSEPKRNGLSRLQKTRNIVRAEAQQRENLNFAEQ